MGDENDAPPQEIEAEANVEEAKEIVEEAKETVGEAKEIVGEAKGGEGEAKEKEAEEKEPDKADDGPKDTEAKEPDVGVSDTIEKQEETPEEELAQTEPEHDTELPPTEPEHEEELQGEHPEGETEDMPEVQEGSKTSVDLETRQGESLDQSTPQLTTVQSGQMSKVSKDKFASLAKTALGSIIDIRQLAISGEVSERKMVRYANSYKMEADNPFNAEKVDKILMKVMEEALENLTYDGDKCPKQAKWASMAIRTRVKKLNFDRYKIVCVVTIGEKQSQDVLATCKFLWDAEKDNYAAVSLENTYVFGYAQCFGLYYE